MVFFHFGKDSSSWAAGNECFAFEYNLQGELKTQWDQLGALFQDKSMAGTRIAWLSTGPDGSYCVAERNGTIYSNRTDLMQAIQQVVQASTASWNTYTIEHVSFSPYGAWFMRIEPTFGHGMVQISAKGRFGDAFVAMATPYLNFSDHGIQRSKIKYAFFGADDAVLIRLSDFNFQWDRLPAKVAEALQETCRGSSSFENLTVGKNTVLCPYDAEDYFLHLEPVVAGWCPGKNTYMMDCRGLTVDFLNALVAGSRPPPHAIPKVTAAASLTQKPAPSKPAAAQPPKAGEEWWTGKLTGSEMPIEPADDDEVPAPAREAFEGLFHEHVRETGRQYLTGLEASTVMRETGLSEEILSEIWERTDVDHNGKFDKEEFVQAMWLLTIEVARLKEDGVVSTNTTADPEKSNNPFNVATNFAGPKRTNSMAPNQGPSGQDPNQSSNQQDASEVDKVSKQFGDLKLRESLMNSIVSEKPNVKWEDVAGLEPAKEELQQAIIFPLRFPQLFQGTRKARRAILMYGPPGTGKSYLAKAVATEVEHTLFSISSSDVMSKWYGDSESLVRQLFELAREKKPAIIFIDEIDALCSNRDGGPGGGNEDTARMKTEFLVQMDGVGKDNAGVLVLAATNLPWSLDPAVRRRFQRRIHIPLPDLDARKQLFKIHLGDMAKNCSEADIDELARRSEGFSGSDVAIAIQDGLMVPIKKVHSATHFKKVRLDGKEWYTPCEKGDPGASPMTWKKVPPNSLKEPALTAADLLVVMQHVKSSVTQDEIGKYHDWTNQFGMEGA